MQHWSQNPIHNPPQGFNNDNFPNGNWKWWVGGTIGLGLGAYQVKDAFNEQMKLLFPNPPPVALPDKTYVAPRYRP